MNQPGAVASASRGRVPWERIADYAVLALLLIASMALYVRTLAPGLLEGDEGEFQVNMFRLGVSHTGYPTFFLLGKLWMLLVPIGTMATRANLFSAFWGAVTIAATYLLVVLLTRNRWAGIITAVLLTASRVEWSQAVIPRPYTLNSLFVVGVPLLLFMWRAGKVDITVPAFALGLSLTNHRTMMWFGPAIALYVLLADYHTVMGGYRLEGGIVASLRAWLARSTLLKPRRLVAIVAAGVLPLLLYGYVFWRGESDVGVEFHWKDFNDEILGGYVRASWRFGPFDWLVSRVTELYIPMLIEQFTAVGFGAGLIGMVALALDRPPRGWQARVPAREVFLFILVSNIVNAAFCVIFWVIDIDKFFLPCFITFLFYTGVGVAVVWDWGADLGTRLAAALKGKAAIAALAFRVLIVGLFAGATAFLVVRNLPLNDWSWRTDVARTWDENLALPLEQNAVIAGSWESITPLEYAMYVDGRRRDLERWKLLIKNYQMGQVPYGSRQDEIERAVSAGRAVYLTIYPGETETLGTLVDKYRLTRIGDLWRVIDAPPVDAGTLAEFKNARPMAVLNDRDGKTLELLGYAVHPSPALQAGDFGLVTLYWRLPQSVSEHLSVSLRLTDAANHLISQRDSEPASGLRATNGWSAGEVVQDDIGVLIPPDAPPGDYKLTVVVYNRETGENWKSAGGATVALNDLTVSRTLDSVPAAGLNIPHPLDTPLPPLRLRGYAAGNSAPRGGDLLDLSLWWQLDQPTAHGETIAIALKDGSGRETSLYAGAPVDGFAASEWGRDAVVRGRYSLALPLDARGSGRLSIRSQDKSTEIPLAIQPSERSFVLPHPAVAQTAQIGDAIKLLGYDANKTQARPGETVRLTLYWQAVKSPAASYTVFVHLLDASGALRGQKDSIPRGGALPTERWLAGEVVADEYDLTVAADAPAGGYQFEVGLYLAESGERLPVTDALGNRVPDDRVLLQGAFKVTR